MRESVRLIIKDNALNTNCMPLIFVASTKLLGKNFVEIDKAIKKLVIKL